MVQYIKETGKMVKDMDLVNSNIQMEEYMKVIGWIINIMVKYILYNSKKGKIIISRRGLL